MNKFEDLIILRNELVDEIEITRKDTINCLRKSFIKQEELNDTRKKYFHFKNRKGELKTKKNRIIITSIILLIVIILTMLLSIIMVSFFNVINMLLFKMAMNTIVLGEFLLSILVVLNMFLKYDEEKNYISINLNNIKLKLRSLENELKVLSKEHLSYCRILNEKESKRNEIDNFLNDKLYKQKSVKSNSEALLEQTKNKQRVRIP